MLTLKELSGAKTVTFSNNMSKQITQKNKLLKNTENQSK